MGQVSNRITTTKQKKCPLPSSLRVTNTCGESRLVSLASSIPTLDVSPNTRVLLLCTARRFMQTQGGAALVSPGLPWQSFPLKQGELLHCEAKGTKEG